MEDNNINNHNNINNINTENKINKKYIHQLLYNNIVKSSKKDKSNLSIIPNKFNKKKK